MKRVITIDGGAATGKSTAMLRLSRMLGWRGVSTGHVYRAATVLALTGNTFGAHSVTADPNLIPALAGNTFAANSEIVLQVTGAGGVPSDATSVVLNMTSVDGTAASFVTVYPDGEARPNASALNVQPAIATPNMITVKLGSNGKVVTMGIPSNGEYGIPKDVMFGYPVTTANGKYEIVQGLEIDAYSQEKINITLKELEEERAGVQHLLG